MDPITHGLLGACAGGAVMSRKLGRWAYLVGGLAGMAADLDVLIRTDEDHLLGMLWHRHFTHSLMFVVVGAGLVTGLMVLLRKGLRGKWKQVYVAALAGYVTHGLLDACTSYGTLWYWPWSWARVAWDVLPIVDPVMTGVLLLGVVLGLWRRGRVGASWRPAVVGLCLAFLYGGLGVLQHERGLAVQKELASRRGHVVERGRVLPTVGNLLVWRSLYESGGRLYADGVRLGWKKDGQWGGVRVEEGASVEVFTGAELAGKVVSEGGSGGTRGGISGGERLEKFLWFVDGYAGRVPGNEKVVGDMRYSLSAGGFDPLWGLMVEDLEGGGVRMKMVHLPGNKREGWQKLMDDLSGRSGKTMGLESGGRK